MKRIESFFRVFTGIFVSILSVTLLYRACSLSMTWDESYTVCVYAANFSKIFSPADFFPNNHTPHTLLVWAMFQLFPYQEWAMRLPATLAGCGTLLLLWKISLLLFENSENRYRNTFFLTTLVSLHPLVFQFFSFARGYSASLFFSLLGFYYLIHAVKAKKAVFCLFTGITFGLSVAFNLSAALMNTVLIAAFLLLGIQQRNFSLRDVPDFLFRFCLPSISIVLIFYVPFLFSISQEKFNYASETFVSGIVDMTVWTLGNSNIVPAEHLTRLILGIPVSEETFFLTAVLLPVFAVALLASGLSFCFQKDSKNDSFAAVALALTLYFALLLALEMFGKTMFPKDRTGILPIAYLMMLPVLALDTLGKTAVLRRVFITGIVLCIVHFLTLFAFPYYHNFWYADSDVRSMMKQAEGLFKEHEPPKRIVCLFLNETAVQFYKKKYAMNGVEYRCVHQIEELALLLKDPAYTLFIMPENILAEQIEQYRVLYRNPYTGEALLEL